MTRLLRFAAWATVFTAPLEGYLLQVHGQAAKLPPALLAVVWVAVRVRRREPPQPHPVHAVLALFTLVLLVSAATTTDTAYTIHYTIRWLPFLVVTVILIDVASRELPIRSLLAASVAGAAVAAVGALHSLFAAGETRATGPLEDPNDLAYFLVAALPLLVALTRKAPTRATPTPARRPIRQAPRSVTRSLPGATGTAGRAVRTGQRARSALARRGRRAGFALVASVLVAGAAATFSRGGALALVAVGVWLPARRAVPLKALVVAAAAVTSLGVAAVLFAGPELDRALREKTYIAGTNVDTRELRWQAAARMVADHPVLGTGPGGFRAGYPAASHNAEIDEQRPVAHNMYLEVAAELGVPGFGLFAALLALTAATSERVLRATPTTDRLPIVAVQASLIAVAVASTFLSQQYYLPLWSLIAVVAAADLRLRRTSDVACAPRDQ